MAELTLKDLIRLGHADPHETLKVYSHFVIGMEVKIEEYMEKLG